MTSQPATVRPVRTPPVIERVLAARLTINWEIVAYAALFALAISLRFWDLGARALHHDESIHAQWSWRLAQGDYRHDPVFHGPFYYHVQGLVFFLFGASDYTARVSAALFGSGLAVLPLLIRRRLGSVGTFAAVAFIAFSPTLVYYSRFFREDIYMAFFTLLLVAAMWRYFEDGRDRWLILFAVAFTGSMTTKEATFLTAAVLLVFLDLYIATELATQTLRARDLNSRGRRTLLTLALAPYAWGLAALWPFIGPVRRRMDWQQMPRSGDMMVIVGTLILPLLTPVLHQPLEDHGFVDKGRLVCRSVMPRRDALALAGLFSVTASMAAFVGLQWRPKTWAIAAGLSAVIYLTLMTSFWTNLGGACTGPWGSLDYWISQHGATRGEQPWFYYYMLMPAYEFLPLALCLGGVWWSVVRGDVFSRFLWLWLAGMWIALSIAGEKMPWLNTHLALPACILAAWTVNRAWKAWQPRPTIPRVWATLLSVATIGAGSLAVIAFLPGGAEFALIRVLFAVFGVAAIAYAARPQGRSAIPTVAVAAVIGALAFFSVRTMIEVTFVRGDVPKDLLIYTQSSPEIPRIAQDIDHLAEATGKGYRLPIAVDSTDSFAWPWAWYLRDYTSVSYVDFKDGPPQGDFAVLLVNSANLTTTKEKLAAGLAPRYSAPEQYPHRWWFDETYKEAFRTSKTGSACTTRAGDCGLWTGTLFSFVPNFVPNTKAWKLLGTGIFKGQWLPTWFRYWRDHDRSLVVNQTFPRCPSCGSVDGYAFFPANFNRATGEISARPIEAAKPGVDKGGRPTFGGLGSQPGQFFAPVDIEADVDGNLYVVDSATKKVQKFDAKGNFLAAADIRLNPGDTTEQAQPWGLALTRDGRLVVADTFGWRIRILDTNLKETGITFGQPPDPAKTPGPFDLFGPRDAIIDQEGILWVTDTGNKRIVQYTLKGDYVRTIGTAGAGPGQFNEPVGIALAPDGTVFVADMYNSRVQILRADGSYLGEFKVEGWGGQDVNDKPYIRVLRDGRIALSLPSLNQVRIYDRSGKVLGLIAPTDDPLNRPYGLVETADGKLWVSEGGAARVRLFDIP